MFVNNLICLIEQARVRLHQARRLHATYESANTDELFFFFDQNTDELGVTADTLINKGTGWTKRPGE